MKYYIKYCTNLFLLVLFFLFNLTFYSKAENFNACIKNAIENNIPVNKILARCRGEIKDSLPIGESVVVPLDKSQFISTSKTEEIIHKLIEAGDLDKASDLAERLEIEKTKRVKAQAEAEALRSPQVITNTTSSTSSNSNKGASSIRSIILLGSNPITTSSSGSSIITITAQGSHGAIAGQYVTLANINASIDGIPASDFNKRHTISSILSINSFNISVFTPATSGSVSGGGSSVTASFEN